MRSDFQPAATSAIPGGLDVAATNAQLMASYLRILTPGVLGRLRSTAGLSNPFLPFATEAYCRQQGRILVVGRAPKRWLNDEDLCDTSIDDYARRSAVAHALLLQTPPGRHKFLQFLSRGNSLLEAPDSAIGWCNLFAVSHAKASPTALARTSPEVFSVISKLSQELLDAQLKILRPHVICFTVNPSFDQQLNRYFGARMSPPAADNGGARLRFEVDGIPAWRINHPRSLAKVDREAALSEMIFKARSIAGEGAVVAAPSP